MHNILKTKTVCATLFATLFAGSALYAESAPTFKSIKSELEDMRFYTKENYVRDHAADYISQINSSNLTEDEHVKLWRLFVQQLMSVLFISDGYGKADLITEGSKPSALPSGLTYLTDFALYQINTSNLITHETAASLFATNWAPLEPKIKKAKKRAKKAFFVSLLLLTIISLPAANHGFEQNSKKMSSIVHQSLVPVMVYARALAGGVVLAAIVGGLFYLFSRLRIKMTSNKNKFVRTFEVIVNRLTNIMASEGYTATMPSQIKKQIAAALSAAEEHALPSPTELKTKEGEKALRARQLPIRNLFLALNKG